MEVIREKKALKFENSKNCFVYEYPLKDSDIGGAIVKLFGRYPDNGYVKNLKCKEMIFVLKGSGKVVINKKEILLEAKDLVLICPEEKFFFEGNMEFFVSTNPPWSPDQYESVF